MPATALDKLLKSHKGQSLEALIDGLISLLKWQHIRGAEPCANATACILVHVVAKSKWTSVEELIKNIKSVGVRLVQAASHELVIGNVVRRVLGLIRDEVVDDQTGAQSQQQQQLSEYYEYTCRYFSPSVPSQEPAPCKSSDIEDTNLSTSSPSTTTVPSITAPSKPINVSALRSEIIDGIEEIMDEISQVDDQIASFAESQIHPGDYVLVYRPSATVERFLIKAAQKRNFTVFIGNDAPVQKNDAEKPYASLRKKLSAAGIEAIILMSAGFAVYMAKVNKVILGCESVLADGTAVVRGSAATIALVAKAHHRPVAVLAGVHQLCPESSCDFDSLVEYGDSSEYVSFADGPMVSNVEVENATTDTIEPQHIDLYITNLGPHCQSQFHSVINDHYKAQDVNFARESCNEGPSRLDS